VAGVIWGSKLGVQFSLQQVALKALPVVILGGFTSIPGAIIGGLIIGLGEKISEVYLGPMLGGGIENWFAYVWRWCSCCSARGIVRRTSHRSGIDVIYRETGQFKTTYASDQQLFPILQDRIFVIGFLVFAFGVMPSSAASTCSARSWSRSSSCRSPPSGSTSSWATAARYRSAPAPSWRSARTRPTTSRCACRT
jgi:hypothetical protein